jgi:putative drug exporter of the RND superfamily
MAGPLDRLGRCCARHRAVVLVAWAVALAGVLAVSDAAGLRTRSDPALPGTQSDRARQVVEREVKVPAGAPGRLVYGVDAGTVTEPRFRAEIEASMARVRAATHVASVTSPFTPAGRQGLSSEGKVAYASVWLDIDPEDLLDGDADAIVAAARDDAPPDLQVAFGGAIGHKAAPTTVDHSEAIGLAAAAAVLLVTLGGVVAMGLPIVVALAGLAAGLALVTLAGHVIEVPTLAPTLATMIGLGVGIDYALFVVTRHQEQLRTGMALEDSVARATATSGAAVVFAGGTVIIALGALALAGIPMVSALGYTAAIVVVVAVLAAITLLPAILASLGPRINALRVRRPAGAEGSPRWRRWGEAIAGRPVVALTAGLGALLLLAAPATALHLGQTDAGDAPRSTEERRVFDLMAEGFGPGSDAQLALVLTDVQRDDVAAIERIVDTLDADRGIARLSPPLLSRDRTTAVVAITPTTAPADRATDALVQRIRREIAPAVEGIELEAYLGGRTAGYVDLAHLITHRLPRVIGAVIALCVVLLMLAFRSIFVPLQAAVMNLLSVAAAYGVLTAVFQWGWGASLVGLDGSVPIVSFVPLMMFAVLFGLSMDYEVFLLSRIQERWRLSGNARSAVVEGISGTGRIITAAALIMICVFGSFVLDASPTVKQCGVGMAVAVAIDATLIRCLVVPASLVLAGRGAWWLPAGLDRALPRLGIEDVDHPEAVTSAS